MDFVAVKVFANVIGPGKEMVNVRRVFQVKEPQSFVAPERFISQDALGIESDSI
jgi:hypothetical protein